MSYKRNPDSGNARYGSWIQLPDDLVIPEGTDSIAAEVRKYAQLVYLANAASINVSLSGQTVKTDDVNYAQYVKTSGNYTYVMTAIVGSGGLADPVWQMKRIYDSTSGEIQVMWADGNDNFDNVANDWVSKSFTF